MRATDTPRTRERLLSEPMVVVGGGGGGGVKSETVERPGQSWAPTACIYYSLLIWFIDVCTIIANSF